MKGINSKEIYQYAVRMSSEYQLQKPGNNNLHDAGVLFI